MTILRVYAESTSADYQRLYRKIRSAEDPDNPALILLFLELSLSLADNTVADKRRCLKVQFQLLLDTLADEHLPSHWRCQCLDNIYRPLRELQRIACCRESKQQVRLLMYELRIISCYFQAGLSS